jgi:protein involved in polysaccharide export with SLBB domain
MNFLNKKNNKFNIFNILFLSSLCFLIFNNQAFSAETLNPSEIPVRQESIRIIKNENSSNEKYKISSGDILSISVYDEPDLTQSDIVVRPDGCATINPIGEVYVEGLDIHELTNVLEEKFKPYLNNPQVS